MDKQAKEQLKCERGRGYFALFSRRDWIIGYITQDPQIMLWKYHKRLRKSSYYYRKYKTTKGVVSICYMVVFVLWKWRKNRMGNLLSVDIRESSFNTGLMIYHNNIIVNGNDVIGKNCKLHGNNVIGNNGISKDTPVIGNNVDIGSGAIIIGGVHIADNIKIGAGAVVTKSFEREGATIVGVPAREVR